MKVLEHSPNAVVLHLSADECEVLREVLGRYPLLNGVLARQDGAGGVGMSDTDTRLLEEALAEARAENRAHLDAFLEGSLVRAGSGWRWSFTREEREWLLAVVNDLSVGSWIAAGRPDLERPDIVALSAERLVHLHLVQVSQAILTLLLHLWEE